MIWTWACSNSEPHNTPPSSDYLLTVHGNTVLDAPLMGSWRGTSLRGVFKRRQFRRFVFHHIGLSDEFQTVTEKSWTSLLYCRKQPKTFEFSPDQVAYAKIFRKFLMHFLHSCQRRMCKDLSIGKKFVKMPYLTSVLGSGEFIPWEIVLLL